MDAGFESSKESQNKSLSIKLESIEKNTQFKFMDLDDGQKSKRVNMLLENLSRQDHKSHLTDNNKSQIFKSPTPPLNDS
jgi:hypothetical protein